MFTSTAVVKVITDPIKIGKQTKCLITAITSNQLAEYYRHQTNRSLRINLVKPSWNAHITVSKVNKIIPQEFHNQKINFKYDPTVRFSGDVPGTSSDKFGRFWFIDCFSVDIRAIRASLKLPDLERFHITIGICNDPGQISSKMLNRLIEEHDV